ncbi:MAG: molybdenum cofactor guanylyltransferase [Candidatus Thorarchaeota archaeon]
MEKVTVAILAGGSSKRFCSEKALADFQGSPLISHMVNIAKKLSSEIMIVVSDEEQEAKLREVVPSVRVVVDPPSDVKCALAGALTAFEYTLTQYTLLLPVDTPLASVELLRMMIRMSSGHGAVVPSWPSGYIEPLHSVYLAEHAYYHGLKVMEEGRYKMSDMLDALKNVLYISTETLKQFDPDMDTFVNFNTPKDLKNAERKVSKKRGR